MKNKIKQQLVGEPLSFHGDILAYIDGLNIGKSEHDGFAIDNGIATIKVRGLLIPHTDDDYTKYGLTGYNIIKDYLTQADSSHLVRQIVLDIDSHGGFIKGLSDVVETIAGLNKPISSHTSGQMLSSAYWLGSSTSHISADKNALVGSVGTYITHVDLSEHYAKDGVNVQIYKSGKWKGAFDNRVALSDDEKSRLQTVVDESANQFISHVAKMRGLSVDDVKSWEGDTFNASIALDKQLIDDIGEGMNLSEALAELEKVKAESKSKDEALAQATAQAKENAEALTAYKASVRDEQIKALGKAFGDDELTAMRAMDDTAFALFAKHSKTVLPKDLTTEQFTNGVQANGDELDQAIANLK